MVEKRRRATAASLTLRHFYWWWGEKGEEIKLNTVWHRLDQTQSSLLLIPPPVTLPGADRNRSTCREAGAPTRRKRGSAAGAEGRSLNVARRTAKTGPGLRISAAPSNLFACSQAGRHRCARVCEHEIGPRIKPPPPPPPPPSWILRLSSSDNCGRAAVHIVQMLHYHL